MPLVIFTDEYSQEFIYNTRKKVQLENVTKIYNTSIETLPLFKKYDLFNDIIMQEQQGRAWNPAWNQAVKDMPETSSVEFMILENSKSYFLSNASKENVYNTTFFAWIDATYGKGNASLYPFNYEWDPEFPPEKISIIKVVDLAVNDRMVDDDETMLVLLINKFPNLFNIVQGEWFNAFHLF
uniref:Uncharacterized protein n=1 Tax=Ditylenchus dipsaci TaxID=166011 RepID=A0A915ETA1_9BILA